MTKYTTAYSWTGHMWLILATRDCKNKYINDILTTMNSFSYIGSKSLLLWLTLSPVSGQVIQNKCMMQPVHSCLW